MPKEQVMSFLADSLTQFEALPTLLRLSIPPKSGSSFTIFGDTHGQFMDLSHILSDKVAGFPSVKQQFLFNGDFVDRGRQSFEVIMTLLAIKLAAPNSLHLLRGNHETTMMNKNMGFESEIVRKYDHEVLDAFRKVFSAMPLAAVLEDECFVVHGGIGKLSSNMTLDEIDKINRFSYDKAEENGVYETRDPLIIQELLWSDPGDHTGFKKSGRGGSVSTFGSDISAKFLDMNKLKFIVRSHEVQMKGYSLTHDGRVVTVFSAPNYCGNGFNLGAFMRFTKVTKDDNSEELVNRVTFQKFNPLVKPDMSRFIDMTNPKRVFKWPHDDDDEVI